MHVRATTDSGTASGTASGASIPRGRAAIAGAMLFGVALIAAYWLIWFLVDRDLLASAHTSEYFAFENAFPAADAWLGATLLLGAIGLLRRRPWGLLATLLAGGAGIYLGCMDVLFDLENGIYQVRPGGDPAAVAIEIVINVLTFGLGVVVIAYAWRNRAWFLSAPIA
jgi:hypothetical protein